MIVVDWSNEQLIEVVKALDAASNKLSRRFEGDDTAIIDLMNELGLSQNIVDKALNTGAVLREATARGIHIPRAN